MQALDVLWNSSRSITNKIRINLRCLDISLTFRHVGKESYPTLNGERAFDQSMVDLGNIH